MFVPDMAVILLSKHSSLNIFSTAELEKCKDEIEQEKVIYQNIKVWTIRNSTPTDVFENRSRFATLFKQTRLLVLNKPPIYRQQGNI